MTTAIGIITLLEQVEPGIQAAALAIVSLWKDKGPTVPVILEGEVTSLQEIINKARAEEGLPKTPAITDPDPSK